MFYIVILTLVWRVANYVLDIALPDQVGRALRVLVTVLIVIAAIVILLSVFGLGGLSEVPRLRGL